jgi:hypothetical protein
MTTDMSTESGSSNPTPTPSPRSSRLVPAVLDAVIVAVWFIVAGLVGAWVWSQVTTLPQVSKSGNNATIPSEELVKQVGMDSWFFVIALAGGVLSGVLLLAWRRRDPLLTVVLVVLGGGLASWLMIHVGKAIGPADPIAALRKLPDGAHVSEQLRLHADGVAWAWSIAAAFGALLYLWVLAKPDAAAGEPDTLP